MTNAHDQLLPDILHQHAQTQGGRYALRTLGGDLTYAELNDRVSALANGLASHGVRRGSKVGLMCTNRLEWVVASLAAIRLGATIFTFNTWARKWDLKDMLEQSECEILIALSQFRDTDVAAMIGELVPEAWRSTSKTWASTDFPHLKHIVLVNDGLVVPGGLRAMEDLEVVQPDDTRSDAFDEQAIFVMFTSGSTARPKAVPIHHAVAVQHAREIAERMSVVAEDVIWVPVPLFWSYGGANALLVGLVSGATLVLQEVFSPDEALDLIQNRQCTVAYTLPNITAAILADPGFEPSRTSTLRKGMTIGSPADVEQAALKLGVKNICNAYGSTELYGGCCVTPWDWPLERKMACQGPPLPSNKVVIREAKTGAPMAVGEVGEIAVRGQVTSGYVDQPDATMAAFSQDGEFLTSDLGYLDEEGCLHFVARASEMIRCGGINIAPAEVEEFLRQHDKIAEVALVGIPDDAKGEVAVACVKRRSPDFALTQDDLHSFCRGEIASFKIPEYFVITDDPLPRTDTGKLSRALVRELAMKSIVRKVL